MLNNRKNINNGFEELEALENELFKNDFDDFDKCFGSFEKSRSSSRKYDERIQETCFKEKLRALCERDCEVYVDTCSLIHDSGLELLEEVETIFPRYRKKLYIFSSVLFEVNDVGKKNPDKSKTCDQIRQKLNELESKGIVKVLTSANKSFSDVNFISQFVQRVAGKDGRDLVLITQDRDLAVAINGLCDYYGDVVKTRSHCEALRIGKSLKLERFYNNYTKEEYPYGRKNINYGFVFMQ